jgi:CBS domain-containing protein
LLEAVDLITASRVSGLCVISEDGLLLGILSELDCLRGILDATYSQGTVGLVREHMISENINSARISDDIINVATDMLAKGQRRRPVVSDNNQLVGQITCRQILAGIRKLGASS